MNDPILAPPPPELPPSARSRTHTVLAVVLSSVGVLLVVVVVAGFFIHLPYVIISPGSATPLDAQVVQIEGAQTYPDDSGDILFLTVQVSTSEPNVWRVVTAWLDPDRDLQDRNAVQGCLTDAQNQQFNSDLMDQSQNDAKYVALTRLGYDVPANPVQIRVVEVCRDAPAHGALETGDQVLAVDGTSVTDAAQVGELVREHQPGDRVDVTYDRNGVTRTASVSAGEYAADQRTCVPTKQGAPPTPTSTSSVVGRICLGVSSQEFVTYQFPIDVKINTQLVGGPSAGLAFTLAIIDDLTPGPLTGGTRVAVTGTIRPDGTVGEVGGVEQKAITARTKGVELMIVPKAEVKDARSGAGDVRVVGVENIEQALDALREAGGAGVPPPSTTAARS
jgi:Lon-like protease